VAHWPIGNFGWFFDITGFVIAWLGISCLRAGCEEVLLNREKPPSDGRRDGVR
jgi:hypothetical protein